MAPELILGTPPGPSVDQYALGVVAYQLLTGQLPFAGVAAPAIMYSHVNTTPPPPRAIRHDLPAMAESVLLLQLAKSPEDRFLTSSDFVETLADTLTVSARLRMMGEWRGDGGSVKRAMPWTVRRWSG
jgi:serine/threonine protein kinase